MRWSSIAIALACLARIGSADAPAAKAEALFRQGRELMTAGKLAEACAAFDASQKLDPATTTLFNQADCREKNKQLATAWGLFVEAERQTRAAVDDTGMRLHKVAVERAAKLEPRLSKMTVKVANPIEGLAVLRDADVIEPGEWNRALPIDGGTYTFTAKVANREVWSEIVTVGAEGDNSAVEVNLKHVHAPPQEDRSAPQPAQIANPTAPSRGNAKLATVGAAVLLGGALVFDLWGNSSYNDAVATNNMDEWNSANDKRYLAEGFLVTGLACTGIAIYLWTRSAPESLTHAIVAPTVANGFAGLQLDGRW